jgi:hypothetical protein
MGLLVLDGRAFTLWLTDDADESVIFSGIARWNGQSLFVERQGAPNFEVRPEWYQRIFPVTDQQSREILLGADYCLRLQVGSLEPSDKADYEVTGLQWPKAFPPSREDQF